MATNKFATKITLVLTYAILEWTLIILLLFNSLFSFLIIKFSQLFALKSPCFWCSCSTLYRFFEPQNVNFHRDLLCELHSKEISVLGFCPNHKKIAEIKDFCRDCFSCHLGFQSEVKISDEDEENLKCSCCGLKFEKKRGDSSSDFPPQDLDFFFDFSGNQLVPIELVDSEESQNISDVDQDHQTPGFESMELEETENSLVFHAIFSEFEEKSAIVEEVQESEMETRELDPNTHLVDEESEVPVTGLELKSLSEIHNDPRAEESLDGSLMSEMEDGDPISTKKKLKSALRLLKAELEEERSASAIAASETMAMITRLQEEKAAMQMEALQYQRMMEEQSEYDQEALQLLNELMIKKEKELEMYRTKVADYEAKFSYTHSEDGNGMTIETTHEWNGNQESGVLEFESSLADFEEERLSIFDQIKVLEEKLFALSDEEDQHFADVRPIEDLYEENGFHSNNMVNGIHSNDMVNGFHSNDMVNGIHSNNMVNGIHSNNMVNGIHSNDMVNGFHSNDMVNGIHSNELENRKKRTDIEEEIDQVYERLQALEADREFLKHCVGSLNKGEKGIELLREILQHLRDLRTTDLQT